jgi:hypothetical protein
MDLNNLQIYNSLIWIYSYLYFILHIKRNNYIGENGISKFADGLKLLKNL